MRRLTIPGGLIAAQVPLVPPEFANLQFWFDFTDPDTVFSDVACTTKANNGDLIECITNKGFSTIFPDLFGQVGPGEMRVSTNVINGRQVAAEVLGGGGMSIQRVDTESSGATGMTMAFVARRRSLSPSLQLLNFGWGSPSPNVEGLATPWSVRPTGLLSLSTLKTIVLDEWVYVYMSTAENDNNVRAAGEAEQNYTGAFTQTTGLRSLTVALEKSEVAEVLLWNIAFVPASRTDFVSYVDSKYMTLPHL